jgi:polysaccharide biosynthesis protein PslG
MTQQRTFMASLRRALITAALFFGIFAVLLALDLANHGLAWQAMWSLTGEENPVGQIRGTVEWAGSLIRPQPDTQPYAVIAHTDVNPYGMNTSLEQEVEPEKRERQLQMISEAGFAWIRQEFPWEDIEIHGRGDFIDRRNDTNGDSQPDEIDAWTKYDNIVDLAEQYGLEIQARLSNPPEWAQSSPETGNFAPPADVQDYVNYAVAVAERYRGRIRYYQVWNEPNIYPEWGEQFVDPETYTDLLCRTYDALKAVDPNIVVISGALAPTSSLSGRDLSDFIFLQRMYDDGAGACFDILSMQGYGLYSGPTDRRMRPTTVNFSRNLYIRDLMVANGDAGKPIWISEAAWSPVGEPSVPTDITGYGNYGRVTLEQAARYMPIAYERARQEWPWVGVINYWFFKRATDTEKNQAFYYFRMVEPDFTPLPVYDSMRATIQADTIPILYFGIHQETHPAITYQGNYEPIGDQSAQLHRFMQTSGFRVDAHGTDVRLRVRDARDVVVRVDGIEQAAPLDVGDGGWQEWTIHRTFLPETHLFEVSSPEPFDFDSITVFDRGSENVVPVSALAAAGTLLVVYVVVSALRARFRR